MVIDPTTHSRDAHLGRHAGYAILLCPTIASPHNGIQLDKLGQRCCRSWALTEDLYLQVQQLRRGALRVGLQLRRLRRLPRLQQVLLPGVDDLLQPVPRQRRLLDDLRLAALSEYIVFLSEHLFAVSI